MQIYLDFDNCLYNTRATIEKMLEILSEFNISNEKISQKVEEIVPHGFTFEKLLSSLNIEPHQELIQKLYSIANQDYLFDDCLEVIAELSQKADIHLLSFGHPDFQNHKWQSCQKLHPYFKTVNFVLEISKGDFLATKKDSDSDFIFVDDKLYELTDVDQKASFVNTFQIIRYPETQRVEHNQVIYSLRDLQEFL